MTGRKLSTFLLTAGAICLHYNLLVTSVAVYNVSFRVSKARLSNSSLHLRVQSHVDRVTLCVVPDTTCSKLLSRSATLLRVSPHACSASQQTIPRDACRLTVVQGRLEIRGGKGWTGCSVVLSSLASAGMVIVRCTFLRRDGAVVTTKTITLEIGCISSVRAQPPLVAVFRTVGNEQQWVPVCPWG